MSETVVPLASGQGSYLCTVSFYKMPDGSIRAAIEDMPAHVIEEKPTISERFFVAAQWCFNAGIDLMRQGVRFDEETRESQDHD